MVFGIEPVKSLRFSFLQFRYEVTSSQWFSFPCCRASSTPGISLCRNSPVFDASVYKSLHEGFWFIDLSGDRRTEALRPECHRYTKGPEDFRCSTHSARRVLLSHQRVLPIFRPSSRLPSFRSLHRLPANKKSLPRMILPRGFHPCQQKSSSKDDSHKSCKSQRKPEKIFRSGQPI